MSVLVIGQARDPHVEAVVAALRRRDAVPAVVDTSHLPHAGSLTVRYTCCGERSWGVGLPDGGFDLADVTAAWWRRPQHPVLDPAITDPAYQRFALSETAEALAGLWHALDVPWVNDPGRDEVAHRKVYQLRVAQDVGLAIPDTLVTNDPAEARRFVDAHGYAKVVYKAFSATVDHWRETRVLRAEEVDQLDDVALAPVIFQDYVEAVHDLRVTVVGDRVFAAAIGSQRTSYPVDFRMDMANATIEEVELPAAVENGLLELMRRLGLVYGAIDLRLRPDGRYVFLEVNPAGQWLFVEQETGQPISDAIAERLSRASASLNGTSSAPGRPRLAVAALTG